MKKCVFVIATVCLLCGCQAKPKPEKVSSMTPAQVARAWEDAAKPGEGHRVLEPLAGNFKAVAQMWVVPTEKPKISHGKMHQEWILGGRFLQQSYEGDLEGEQFFGRGLLGYDNIAEEYVGIWVDTMTTSLLTNSGLYDASVRQLTMFGEYQHPVTKEARMTRSVLTIEDNGYRLEMFEQGEGEKETKSLEISYTRE